MTIQVTVTSENTGFLKFLEDRGFSEKSKDLGSVSVAQVFPRKQRIQTRADAKAAMRKYPLRNDGTDTSVSLTYDGRDFAGTLRMSTSAVIEAFC